MRLFLGFVVLAGFAAMFGAHASIAYGLARSGEWKRAALALLVPPLAPWWAHGAGMRVRCAVWLGGLVVYAIAVALG